MNTEDTHQLNPGDQVGAYRIVRKIGAGGMGEIYEAWEAELNRRVAIKIIAKRALENESVVERFKAEGRALAKLSSPHIVSVYVLGTVEDRPYIAMEYLEGLPLNDFLMVHPCGVKDLVSIFRQIATGLMAAHHAGIVHRDLKPHNILVDERFNAKLIDFGIAKVYSEQMTHHTSANVFIGTVNYSAPEVLRGQLATSKSDIFALGLVLYFMMTGEVPFFAATQLEVMEKVRSQELGFSKYLGLYFPEELKNIVLKMTAKDPTQRYEKLEDVLEDLKKVPFGDVPPELNTSASAAIELTNRDAIYTECRKAGFSDSEIRFIVIMASDFEAKKELKDAAASDATVSIELKKSIEISMPALREATERFRMVRSRLITQQISKTAKIPKQKTQETVLGAAPKSAPPWLAYIAATLLACAAIIFIFMRTDPGGRAPRFKVGETHSNRTRNFSGGGSNESYVEVVTIHQVADGRYVWKTNTTKEVTQSINLFLPPYRYTEVWQDKSILTEINTIYGDTMGFFPLRVGKKSVNRVVGTRENSMPDKHPPEMYEYTYTCTVIGKETVKLEIGTRNTFKVRCEAKGQNEYSRIYNYDDKIGRVVMIQLENKDRYFEEMISYKLK